MTESRVLVSCLILGSVAEQESVRITYSQQRSTSARNRPVLRARMGGDQRLRMENPELHAGRETVPPDPGGRLGRVTYDMLRSPSAKSLVVCQSDVRASLGLT